MNSDLYVWAVPQCPFSIEYPAALMNQVRLAAMDAFFKIPRGGLEIGGVLFGSLEPGRMRIQAFRMLECEHATGPSFILSDADRARLSGLLVSASEERELAGLAPVGWFRSRTRSEISMSEADVALFDTYFPELRQVVLVLRPEVTRPTRAGFFFREGEGALRVESSYGEFVLEESAVQDESPAPPLAPRPAPPPVHSPELSFLTAPKPRQYSRPLLISAACLSLAAASLGARDLLVRRIPSPERFSLEALDRSGQLQFQWDRSARVVRQAHSGRVEITDGAAKFSADLAAEQLQRGSFYYARQSERVDIHMIVVAADGRSTDEYAIFFGRLPVAVGQTIAFGGLSCFAH